MLVVIADIELSIDIFGNYFCSKWYKEEKSRTFIFIISGSQRL